MKLNMMTVIKDRESEPMLNDKKEPVTLRWVCAEALERFHEDERNLSGEDKFKRGKLVEKLYSCEEPEVSVEERALIKSLVGKGFTVPVVRAVYSLLE